MNVGVYIDYDFVMKYYFGCLSLVGKLILYMINMFVIEVVEDG